MSVRAMAWAFGQRVGLPTTKLVLLSLSDHHNDETGADPLPAIETIAAETEMNERSVRRHLETLETAGLIARRARARGKAYRDGPPVDMMDKPLRASPTYLQAQQQQQEDRFKGILAA
ncbi:MAG: helix-turn-helix domain-containing protein [Rhodospirillales bacterium]|nr:helix-turn-helix domain-containing protein [Rhodospirillales bacterium]MDE0379188.1 helix-turn-helix domain-containing protein [Rhodospirillales bacterium]